MSEITDLAPLPCSQEVATALVQRLDIYLDQGGKLRRVCEETGVGRNWFTHIRKVAAGESDAGVNLSLVDAVRRFFEANGVPGNAIGETEQS